MSVVPENKPEAIDGHQVKETEVVPHVVEVYSVFSSGMRLYLTYLLGIVLLISTLTKTCLSEPAKQRVRWRPIQVFTSFRIILYPDAASILLMIAPSYAVYYTFQAAVPVIFSEVYQYNTLEIGLALMPVLAGLTGGGILAAAALLVDVFPESPSTAFASAQIARCGFEVNDLITFTMQSLSPPENLLILPQ
ncbi:hypothetical protein M7I_4515 [Glarea lozoyensis 74030]|uniref:Uncharacterized protein n=1 Tax=Glarea lozoyensis (strain ATCC 74030 / MF5533) TaxID=1104152 RepID=H0EPE0_GLAL7|nr:hypothetical protein M7I_4515 [Glarea lozoyensis 74030]